jgi:signal transduction histidine kinase
VPNADLLALELAGEIDPEAAPAIRHRLETRLRDYVHVAMPSVQRLFLGRTLQRLDPAATAPRWLDAESLAAEYLAQPDFAARSPELRPTTIEGVWQHASPDGRVILLHRAKHLPMRLLVATEKTGLPAGQRVDFVPPGREPAGALVSMPAGDAFPGWRIVLTPQDPAFFDTAASDRAASYAWIVGLVVVTIVVFAVLAWSLVRRQVALTQLRNDLVANVTHELKTPLASMRLLVDTLLDSPQLNEQTTRDYLQLIAAENLRLSRLIGNFLTFSRIERNKYQFDFAEVPAAAIAEQAATAVRDRLQAPDCRFEVRTPADLPAVSADSDALVTALVNLLDNAWKYSGEHKEIELSAQASNGHVRFAVRDNGLGLSPRDRKRIFGRFQQAHHQRSTGGGGVGLGLSIVQFIVDAHRGTITVDSEPGRGSTFTITLPAVPPSEGT